jgi:hypothetical protein
MFYTSEIFFKLKKSNQKAELLAESEFAHTSSQYRHGDYK